MSRLRISGVQYLNTPPLVWCFTHGPLVDKYDLSFTLPSLCAQQLARRFCIGPVQLSAPIGNWPMAPKVGWSP